MPDDASSTPAGRTYRELAPPPCLDHVVACVWTGVTHGPYTQRIVPDACADIMWMGGPAGGSLVVAGPDTQAHTSFMTPGSVVAAVRFRPGAAGVAFGLPLDAVRDQRVRLAELWGRAAADELADEVAAALAAEPVPAGRPTGAEAAIARAVARRVAGTRPGEGPLLASALAAEDGAGGVRRVADRLGVSERQLHRRSLALFGYGPKTAQRILRFQRALRLARLGLSAGGRGRGPGPSLAVVAAEAGYADQAHLARDVRALAGVTITELI